MTMLSTASAAVVRTTAPVVAEHAERITTVFYRRLFESHPELLNLFNLGNQHNGAQQRALANAVVAYAVHLISDDEELPPSLMERIAHKHASLGIRPDQYAVVGRQLLAAVGEVLGDAVTAEVAAAWDEVYWLFAVHLVACESRLYQEAGVATPEGALTPWRVVDRREEAVDAVSLVLRPDAGPVPDFRPGQYVTVEVELPDGARQARQYTLSRAPGHDFLRITVRRVRGDAHVPDGMVSTHLHDRVDIGDVVRVSRPFGDVTLAPGDGPLILASAGIGITPVSAMVEHLARTQPGRPVVLVHADRDAERHALAEELDRHRAGLRSVEHLRWYEHGAADGARSGLVEVDEIPVPEEASAYLCGPLPFMRELRTGLIKRGVPAERVLCEVFGPEQFAD